MGEAGGEGGLGFRDPDFSTGHFGGVAADEVVHGLFGGEFGDWGQNAAGVTGEEDDICRVIVRDARDFSVFNVFDWVGTVSYELAKMARESRHMQAYHRVFSVSVVSS